MTGAIWRRSTAILAASLLGFAGACVNNPAPRVAGAPRFPDFAEPTVPATLGAAPAAVSAQRDAWLRLQSGDTNGAARSFGAMLARTPAFYPAAAGLGDVALAQKQFAAAVSRFTEALQRDGRYLPALSGLVDADLGAGDQAGAIAALEKIVVIDPARDDAKSRLDVLRLRAMEAEMAAGAAARAAGRLDDAQAAYERALQLSPTSPVVRKELAAVEFARGDLDSAEANLRASLAIDSNDPDAYASLGDVLAARGNTPGAVDAYTHALAIEPRPAWRTRLDTLRARSAVDALPKEYRDIPSATSVTRAQVAAYLDNHLKTLIDRAPLAPPVVITDIRTHWAASWILPVTRAGIMDVQSNHTFLPNAIVRRSELARIVSQILNLVAAKRAKDAAAWRAARPAFSDLPRDHADYPMVAVAVTAGVLTLDGTRFSPTRAVTGAELVAAVTRLEQLAGQ